MKRLSMLIAALVVLVSVDAVHATIIDVFSIRQSVDITGVGAHAGYELDLLRDNPVALAMCQYHGISRLDGTGNQYLIDILQRTLQYEEDDKMGDMPFPEAISMYETNELLGRLIITGTTDWIEVGWNLHGIPDLSKYHIDSLYAIDFTSVSADMADLDIHIVAEVTSVPEPSSFLLLALGAAGICLAKRVRGKTL